MIQTRPYQDDAIERVRDAFRQGRRRVMLSAPTGSGKTVIATQILRHTYDKGRNALFIAHRREIIYQTSEKLRAFGLEDHGVIMAGEKKTALREICVASIDTLHSRITRKGGMGKPIAQLLIFDEAHRSTSPIYQKFASFYPEAYCLGLSATPIRKNGRGLGTFYEELIEATSLRELIDQNYLVPTTIFAPSMPDLKGINTVGGDYVQSQLGKRLNKASLVGNVVKDWKTRARDRQTVVFASSVAHSIHLRDEFLRAGISAAHLDGKTPKTKDDDQRAQILRDLRCGNVQVVCNCQVLNEGWDEPEVSCVVVVRPTKSYGLWLQMTGRTLRPAKGKEDAMIIDHSGAVYHFGAPEASGGWSLDENLDHSEAVREKKKKEQAPTTCRECFFVWEQTKDKMACPRCGWRPTAKARKLSMKEGRLIQIKGTKNKAKRISKELYWRQCYFICVQKNLKIGAAAHMYRQHFGLWPRGFTDPPVPKGAQWKLTARRYHDLIGDQL